MPDPQAPATPQPQVGPASWADLIRHEATQQGVAPELALSVAHVESSGNVNTPPSTAGALGMMQLMPATAKRLGVDPNDPMQNISGGVRELKRLLDENGGDVTKALRGYNGSPQASEAATNPYVQKVYQRLSGGQQALAAAGQPPTAGAQPTQAERIARRPAQPPAHPAPASVGVPPNESWARWGMRHLEETADAFDPSTRTGRRNFGGAGGAIAGAALAPETGGLSLIAPILGAFAGGAATETGEEVAHGEAVSPSTIAGAGGQQALYETVGQGVMRGVVNPVGRRLVGSRVGKFAAEHLAQAGTALTQAKQATLDRLQTGLDSAQRLVETSRTTARQGVQAAADAGRAGVEAAQGATARRTAEAEVPYQALVGTPPDAANAGRQVLHTAFGEGGGAKVAKDVAGKAVTQAAEGGGMVKTAGLKTALDTMGEGITPDARAAAQSATDVTFGGGGQGGELERNRAAWTAKLADLGVVADAGHPLPGLLGELQNLPDEISLSDAHKYKRLLDDAINWDSPAKKQIGQITKGARTQLRDSMRGVSPAYDQATAHYANIAPLSGRGSIAADLRKVATTNPEKIVPMIKAGEPTKAEMLTHLLTTQATAGGGEAEGKAALQSVQAAWIHQKVIVGGIEKLGDRIDALPPAFRTAFLGDPHAHEILGNLHLISDAYQAAVSNEAVQATKEAGRQGVRAAGETGAQAIDRARVGVPPARAALAAGRTELAGQARALKGQTSALARSSLFPKGAVWADVMRAAVLAPKGEFWGFVSLVKLMHGPTARDLITWAGASPAGTRALVKAFTSSTPGLAVADLARKSGRFDAPAQTPPEPPPTPTPGLKIVGLGDSHVGTPPPR